MTKESKQQFTFRISRANPTELVVIIYEMLMCYLEEAKEALPTGDESGTAEAFRKARACVNELMQSVDTRYEPGSALMQLYIYSLKRMAYAQRKQDPEPLQEVNRIMQALHDAYGEIAPQNTKGPVMNNSQTVYAGLTYGRNDLTENMADQGANRGMLV